MRFRGTSTPVISTFISRKCMINYPEVSSPDWITNSPVQTYLLSTGLRDMSDLFVCEICGDRRVRTIGEDMGR
jgi:hypothetical protein